jgi:hypothetical protein
MADRWKRLAPLTGVVFVALVVVSILVSGDQPDVGAGPAEVAAYYASHDGATTAQVVMLAYAALFACVFFTSVGQFLRDRGARTLATLTLVGGILAAVGCGLAAGMSAALTEANGHFAASQMQVLNAVSEDLFWPILVGGMIMATLAMGAAILRTRALPKALGIVTVVVGVVGISGIGSWFGFMGAGVTTLVIAGYVYARLSRPESISLPDVPGQRVDATADTTSSEKAGTA